jgi:hypothetical protein
VHSQKLSAITLAARRLSEEREIAKLNGKILPKRRCKTKIREAEITYNMPPETTKQKTVTSRVDRNNLTGIAPQRVSRLDGIEPLLVEYCLKLSSIGQPLTKRTAYFAN